MRVKLSLLDITVASARRIFGAFLDADAAFLKTLQWHDWFTVIHFIIHSEPQLELAKEMIIIIFPGRLFKVS